MSLATSLLEAFNVLPDPRLARGKEHRWSELLFIAVCALLTGGESFYDMEAFACLRQEWLRTFLVTADVLHCQKNTAKEIKAALR